MREGVGLEYEEDKEWRKRMKEKIKNAESRKKREQEWESRNGRAAGCSRSKGHSDTTSHPSITLVVTKTT
jgi:hypothetical protein